VYPSWKNESDGWHGDILSRKVNQKNLPKWPWLDMDASLRESGSGHYDPSSQLGQFTLELIIRELMTHPQSCLRTMDPDKATLFYVPYLPSIELHRGNLHPTDYSTSKYADAISKAIHGNYGPWEKHFGLTSRYWKRRGGSDHILVFSEPLQGLTHPHIFHFSRPKRGNYHYIHTQMQLKPPIIISVELSTTFVEMFPRCANKNILAPYPNPDGS
jgi:hypothetical protein